MQALAELAVDGCPHFRQAVVGSTAAAGSCESARVLSSDPDGNDSEDARVVVRVHWPDDATSP